MKEDPRQYTRASAPAPVHSRRYIRAGKPSPPLRCQMARNDVIHASAMDAGLTDRPYHDVDYR